MINAISFQGYKGKYLPDPHKKPDKKKINVPSYHTYSSYNAKNDKKAKAPAFVSGALIGAALSAAIVTNVMKPPVGVKYTLPVTQDTAAFVEQMEETFDTNLDMILYYNNLDDVSDLKDRDEISFPSAYSYIDGSIEKVKLELSKAKTPEKRAELEDELRDLVAKKQRQDETALVFSDGKKIYYQILDDINVETFKSIFDIKDGVIRMNNNLEPRWRYEGEYDPEFNDGFYDFTGVTLHTGDIIKVPVSSMKK